MHESPLVPPDGGVLVRRFVLAAVVAAAVNAAARRAAVAAESVRRWWLIPAGALLLLLLGGLWLLRLAQFFCPRQPHYSLRLDFFDLFVERSEVRPVDFDVFKLLRKTNHRG